MSDGNVFGFTIGWSVNGADDELAPKRMSVAFERAGVDFAKFGERLFPKLGEIFQDEEKAQFNAQGRGPARGGWRPLSPAYAERKALKHPGKPILEATGTLREALTSSFSPFAKRVTSGEEFDFGTRNVPYATFHQTGTRRMPDRPEYDFGPDLRDNITKAGAETIREIVRDSGLEEFGELSE